MYEQIAVEKRKLSQEKNRKLRKPIYIQLPPALTQPTEELSTCKLQVTHNIQYKAAYWWTVTETTWIGVKGRSLRSKYITKTKIKQITLKMHNTQL